MFVEYIFNKHIMYSYTHTNTNNVIRTVQEMKSVHVLVLLRVH